MAPLKVPIIKAEYAKMFLEAISRLSIKVWLTILQDVGVFNVNVLFTLLNVYSLNSNNDLQHSHCKSWHFLKVQSIKLYNNKYMMASTQKTDTGIFAFISALVLKLLSHKVLFKNRKRQQKKKQATFEKNSKFYGSVTAKL